MGVPRRVRHDGPFSMDLLNDPRGWGISLVKNALVWEIPRQCVGALVRWRYGPMKGTKPSEIHPLAQVRVGHPHLCPEIIPVPFDFHWFKSAIPAIEGVGLRTLPLGLATNPWAKLVEPARLRLGSVHGLSIVPVSRFVDFFTCWSVALAGLVDQYNPNQYQWQTKQCRNGPLIAFEQ